MNDLATIKDYVVGKGFPELADIVIHTDYRQIKDAYFDLTRNGRKDYLIQVDTTLRHAPRSVVIGGIAHEIAHIVKEIKMNGLLVLIDRFLYDFSWYETRDERNADLIVVQRGLGQKLLSFLRYANKRREEYTEADGLTVTELEKILSKASK